MVDSGHDEEPLPRHFGSYEAAKRAAEDLPQNYWPFVWILEEIPGNPVPVVHMKDGKDKHDV